ncbi:50S ribosomal subunit protein L6 [Hyella patelloides LEGE 07179]|uniref:Large ribosomal subunit protein uL6 n=1 Tax=Hyella patelloides LEGE 07179 TaxID=945734 RepID=A0A563VYD7_9CYAN|nr:50S ribosomal protein L6 [Hyella patelloides]VEP16441.1 50S ribosomal subunit protein L6 [Hyella patelloides LEGE 07179]
MSRIGKQPVPIPDQVSVDIKGRHVTIKGPKGTLSRELPSAIVVAQEGSTVKVSPENNSRIARQRHGLSRTLVANMVEGVSKGFEKRLQIQGVGYRAQAQGKKLTLNVGYSNPVEMQMPEGIQVAVEKNTEVVLNGIDKEVLGNVAARIRAVRPPEPYKGKGIRYLGEQVRRKAGKTGK